MARKKTLTPEQQKEVCKLIRRWNKIVDNPQKKTQAERLFDKIWEIRGGNIRPF